MKRTKDLAFGCYDIEHECNGTITIPVTAPIHENRLKGMYVFLLFSFYDRADGTTTVTSDGLVVDRTPPELVRISTSQQSRFQQQDDHLDFRWEFRDPESGIAEYRCVVLERYQGQQVQFWPESDQPHVIHPNDSSLAERVQELHLSALRLQHGATYSIEVFAINRAKMAAAEESQGVTIDTTPPVVWKVILQ